MKITNLELFRYNRLKLTNIELFVYNPTEPLQLILGTNGSGKTSLMLEMSPLPALHTDYGDNGYKKITLEKNKDIYVLTSSFKHKHEHSFIKNGVELNPGFTITVQKELVKQEFSLTQEIHELLISQSSFTLMSVSERRMWFTKLSPVNYDYAIKVYNKLKEKQRDASGTLRTLKKRLVLETGKLINISEKDSLELKVKDLHELLSYLQGCRKPVEQPMNELNTKYSSLEEIVYKMSSTVLDYMKNTKLKYSSFDDIDFLLDKRKTEKIILEEKLDVLYKEFGTIEDSLRVIRQNSVQTNLVSISNITDLESQLSVKYGLLKLNNSCYIENPIEAGNALNTVYDLLTSVFLELKENENRYYSRQTLETTVLDLSELRLKNKNLSSELTTLVNAKLHQEHQRDNAKTECPSCKHTWSRGYDKDYYDKLCITVEVLQTKLDDITININDLVLEEETIREYFTTFNQFKNCTTNWPVLKQLWDLILNDNVYLKSPRMVINLIDLFKKDIVTHCDIEKINKQLNETRAAYDLAQQTDVQENERVIEKALNLEISISENISKTRTINRAIETLLTDKKNITAILDMSSKLEVLVSDMKTNTDDRKETLRREALITFIKHVQIDLANKERALSEINQQYILVEDITNQISNTELDNSTLTVLVNELSPTDGLIAKGLLGFINNFINKMNKFIKKIWAYPLVIKPCTISTETAIELDYKFPLVAGDAKAVKDVLRGSSAMRDVVDLAFKITTMSYLGLSNHPLYLDEPSAAMDNEHKINSMKAIVSLMEQQNFTQLFLISHDHVQYGSLINTEVCILCPNNIVLPSGTVYNKHVRLN